MQLASSASPHPKPHRPIYIYIYMYSIESHVVYSMLCYSTVIVYHIVVWYIIVYNRMSLNPTLIIKVPMLALAVTSYVMAHWVPLLFYVDALVRAGKRLSCRVHHHAPKAWEERPSGDPLSFHRFRICRGGGRAAFWMIAALGTTATSPEHLSSTQRSDVRVWA